MAKRPTDLETRLDAALAPPKAKRARKPKTWADQVNARVAELREAERNRLAGSGG